LAHRVCTGNFIFLPAGGTSTQSTGGILRFGTNGYYWSSTVNGIYMRGLTFLSGDVYMVAGSRANGFSVRCVAE